MKLKRTLFLSLCVVLVLASITAAASALAVTRISPNYADLGKTITATVTGTGFANSVDIMLYNGATSIQATGETVGSGGTTVRCTFAIPSNARPGTWSVYARNTGTTTWKYKFNDFGILLPGEKTKTDQIAAYSFAKINSLRVASQKGSLTRTTALDTFARTHSQDMANRNFFDHTDPDGVTFANRLSAAGLAGCGEDIAYRTGSFSDNSNTIGTAIALQWWNSAPHKAIILNTAYKKTGVGAVWDNDRKWWIETSVYCP